MNGYTVGQVVGSLIFVFIAAWLIYVAYGFQKSKERSVGKTVGMVILYAVGGLVIISFLAGLAGVGRQ